MNRSYPPYRQNLGNREGGFYAPAEVLMGLIRQSEKRYATYRDLAMKQDQGFGQLQIDVQNMSIALSRDPEVLDQLSDSLRAALTAAQMNKYLLEQACNAELYLQGELKRWLKGQPPVGRPPAVFQPRLPAQAYAQGQQGGPQGPHVFGPVPQGWYPVPPGYGQQSQQPQQPQQPPQGYGQPLPQGYAPQQVPQGYAPQAPQGYVPPEQAQPVDLRNPEAAAAFLKRAQPMPLGVPGQPAAYSPVPPPVAAAAHAAGPATVAAAGSQPAPQPAAPASPHVPANGAAQKGA